MVYFLMTSLAEMASFIPISGSFSTYTARFVDPALGFGMVPLGPIFATVLCLIAMLATNYGAFIGDKIDWYGIAVSYIGLPLFLLGYLSYKITKESKMVPLHEADFSREKRRFGFRCI
jgi:amino acid permease